MSYFRTNDLGEMILTHSNDIGEFDLLEHPEYLEDEFHHVDTFRLPRDHQEYDAFDHLRDHEHHGDYHHPHTHYVESAGHGSTYYAQPIRYEKNYKYVDGKQSGHEVHGHQDETDHHKAHLGVTEHAHELHHHRDHHADHHEDYHTEHHDDRHEEHHAGHDDTHHKDFHLDFHEAIHGDDYNDHQEEHHIDDYEDHH